MLSTFIVRQGSTAVAPGIKGMSRVRHCEDVMRPVLWSEQETGERVSKRAAKDLVSSHDQVFELIPQANTGGVSRWINMEAISLPV